MSHQCSTEANTKCECKTKPAGEGCSLPGKLIALADQAWEELLKEKIKAEIQKSCGDKMDEIAKLVTETNNAKWGHMIEGRVKDEEYKQAIKQLMISCCE